MDQSDSLTREQELLKEQYQLKYTNRPSPHTKANFFQKVLFTWVNPLLSISQKMPYEKDMSYEIHPDYSTKVQMIDWNKNWKAVYEEYSEQIQASKYLDETQQPPVLFKTIFRTFRYDILCCTFLALSFSAFEYVNAGLVYLTVKSFNQKDAEGNVDLDYQWIGALLCGVIITRILLAICNTNLGWLVNNIVDVKLVNIFRVNLLRKSLKKPLSRDVEHTIGEVLNYMTSDTRNFWGIGNNVIQLLLFPFEFILGMILLGIIIGKAIIPTTAVIIFGGLIVKFITKWNIAVQKESQSVGDKKMKNFYNTYSNIRFVKMEALENFFQEKIMTLKVKEIELFATKYRYGLLMFLFNQFSSAALITTMWGFYMYFGNTLKIEIVFTMLSIFARFKYKIYQFGDLISSFINVLVSSRRLNNYFISENIDWERIEWTKEDKTEEKDQITSDKENTIDSEKFAIHMENCNFYWIDKKKVNALEEYKAKKLQKTQKGRCCFGKKDDSSKTQQQNTTTAAIKAPTSVIDVQDYDRNENDHSKKANQHDLLKEPLLQQSTDAKEELLNETMTEAKSTTIIDEDSEQPFFDLKNITFKIPKGSCVAIIGRIGSGKSSLLTSLFGELHLHKSPTNPDPKIKIQGSVSYVSQNSWVLSKPVKDNILFYSDFDENRYKNSIYYSAMTSDLELLPDKDNSMLGDKGVNLSGGQKTRLNIARSIYADSDIVLFDDPISALDIHVGKFIMEETVLGYLQGKTRIIVTHAISYQKYFDYIYIMDAGQIVQEGVFDYIKHTNEYQDILQYVVEKEKDDKDKRSKNESMEEEYISAHFKSPQLRSKKVSKNSITSLDSIDFGEYEEENEINNNYDKYNQDRLGMSPLRFEKSKSRNNALVQIDLEEFKLEPERQESKDSKTLARTQTPDILQVNETTGQQETSKKEDLQQKLIANIITKEDRLVGKISSSTMWSYFKQRGGVCLLLFDFFLLVICKGAAIIREWYIQYWANLPEDDLNRDPFWFQFWFNLWNTIDYIPIIIRGFVILQSSLSFSKRMNFKINSNLLHASVNKFWDRVPIGRVLNRLTTDCDTVDYVLIVSLITFNFDISGGAQTFILCTISSSQLLWIAIGQNFVLCYAVMKYYMNAKRELQRVNSALFSPLIQLYTESLNGLTHLRAFNKERFVNEEYQKLTDAFRASTITVNGLNCWFYIRVQLMSLVVVIPGFALIVLWNPGAGLVALLINNILDITDRINQILNTMSTVETNFVSFERCSYYINLEIEEGYVGLAQNYSEFKKMIVKEERDAKIDVNNEQKLWPNRADLSFDKFSVKYREELDFVQKNLSLSIKDGEKIGIVGRTGAGKSTLLTSIYRTFANYEGRIELDSRNIQNIDQKTLRRNITIIPQDPHLFNDTLKKNLDPLSQFNENDMVDILKGFEIWEKFDDKGGLHFMIGSDGGNLSQGEKQLICMARALLNKNKLILLDEATANIDIITEERIQKALKEYFSQNTILMIAHRLNTIMFCDKVLVLDKGQIVEFDRLDHLMQNPNSKFGKMMKANKDVKDYIG